MPKKEKKQEEGAPAWVVTYGDMMSLLLTFFVLIVSMSELRQDRRFLEVMESIRQAFGYVGGIGRVPTQQVPNTSLLQTLMTIRIPDEIRQRGDTPVKSVEGKRPRVTEMRPRFKLAFGGYLQFERFSEVLLPGREKLLEDVADKVRGTTNLIEIVGHTTLEALPPDCGFATKDDLAIARAQTVRDILEARGIERPRMRLISAADHELLFLQAYSEERRARNRRVEIMVTETLVHDVQGRELTLEERMNHTHHGEGTAEQD